MQKNVVSRVMIAKQIVYVIQNVTAEGRVSEGADRGYTKQIMKNMDKDS